MAPLKPPGFEAYDWPGIDELFTFRSNGIVTYRDDFVYATTSKSLTRRIQRCYGCRLRRRNSKKKNSAMNKAGPALRVPFNAAAIETASYRPLDLRYLYCVPQYVDRLRPELQRAWGTQNFALIALSRGTGRGPATWCHSSLADQHGFAAATGADFLIAKHGPNKRGALPIADLIDNLELAYREAGRRKSSTPSSRCSRPPHIRQPMLAIWRTISAHPLSRRARSLP